MHIYALGSRRTAFSLLTNLIVIAGRSMPPPIQAHAFVWRERARSWCMYIQATQSAGSRGEHVALLAMACRAVPPASARGWLSLDLVYLVLLTGCFPGLSPRNILLISPASICWTGTGGARPVWPQLHGIVYTTQLDRSRRVEPVKLWLAWICCYLKLIMIAGVVHVIWYLLHEYGRPWMCRQIN
jgi:hypothetical protein